MRDSNSEWMGEKLALVFLALLTHQNSLMYYTITVPNGYHFSFYKPFVKHYLHDI